ncbi:MAG: hypothetical protein ABUT20_11610, partial [Bacteroidota bacterium]
IRTPKPKTIAMKNPTGQNRNKMKNSPIAITATLVEPSFLKSLVEQLANRRYDSGYHFEKVQTGWHTIETSSIEAQVSGYINLSEKGELINMPFTKCFLFTCMKGKYCGYDLTWASSLS